MLATAIRRVNTRLESNTSSNKLVPLEIGATIDVRKIKNDEEIEGSNLWLEDKNGTNFWAGAFDINVKNNLSGLVDFRKIWSLQNIAEIKIGILDSGVQINPDFFGDRVVQLWQKDNSKLDMHATYMAAIIGANNIVDGYIGFLPNSKIFSYQAVFSKDGFVIEPQNFTAALKKFLEVGVDIVNISMVTTDNEDFFKNSLELKELLQQFSQKNIPIVVSTGNEPVYDDDRKTFPGAITSTISASGYLLKGQSIKFDFHRTIWTGTTILSPSFPIYDNQFFSKIATDKPAGTSVSAAVTTAILGVMKLLYIKLKPDKPYAEFISNIISDMPKIHTTDNGNLNERDFKYLDFKRVNNIISQI